MNFLLKRIKLQIWLRAIIIAFILRNNILIGFIIIILRNLVTIWVLIVFKLIVSEVVFIFRLNNGAVWISIVLFISNCFFQTNFFICVLLWFIHALIYLNFLLDFFERVNDLAGDISWFFNEGLHDWWIFLNNICEIEHVPFKSISHHFIF